MKVIERVLVKIICERIAIEDMQLGFMPGRGTTDDLYPEANAREVHQKEQKAVPCFC